jgi:hypothetical protein
MQDWPMVHHFRFACVIGLSTLGAACSALAAPEMPSSMVLVGRVAPAQKSALAPRRGDAVLGFAAADGSLVGAGAVFAAEGEYLLTLTRTASFNGASVALELQQGRKRYALLLENNRPAVVKFAGRTLPERTLLALRVGAQTAELTEAEAASPQAQRLSQRTDLPCDAASDVNEDGRCDAADWAILRLYGGGVTRTVAEP